MRLLLAFALLFVTVASTTADQRFRRPNRIMPIRNFRIFDGYNNRFAGYDSSYYSPYTSTNTLTPTPVNGFEYAPTENSPTPQTYVPAYNAPDATTQNFGYPQNGQWTQTTSDPNAAQPRWQPPGNTPGNSNNSNGFRLPSTPTNYQIQSTAETYWNRFEDN